MYTVTTKIDLKPDTINDAARLFQQVIREYVKDRPGYLSSTLNYDVENNTALVIGHWEKLENAQALLDSPDYHEIMGKFEPYFAGKPERTLYEVKAHVTPRG